MCNIQKKKNPQNGSYLKPETTQTLEIQETFVTLAQAVFLHMTSKAQFTKIKN